MNLRENPDTFPPGLADSVFCTFFEELLLHIRVRRIYNIGEAH